MTFNKIDGNNDITTFSINKMGGNGIKQLHIIIIEHIYLDEQAGVLLCIEINHLPWQIRIISFVMVDCYTVVGKMYSCSNSERCH